MYTFEGTPEQKKKYLSRAIDIKMPGIRKRKKWKVISQSLGNRILENDYDNHISRIQQRIDEYGILSLSRKQDDLLMFSYYAKDHTGSCLKYRRVADSILSLAEPITYETTYPKFSIFDFKIEDMGRLGDKVLLTKAECWKHEDEWRVGLDAINTRIRRSPHAILEGIILGCNMKPAQREEILGLNKRRERPVEIFEACKKKFEFALEIVPFTA